MPYMMLIVEPAGWRQSRSDPEARRAFEQMRGFTEGLRRRGVLTASDSLKPDGVRIEVRRGRQIVVDGPFAEAKEIVGGYFLLDVATREDAMRIAAECPATEWGTVEVREVGPCYDGGVC